MLPGERARYDQNIRDKCEADGVAVTRRKLTERFYGDRKGPIVAAWLAEQDAAEEAREREIDRSIPRDANDIARQALKQARWANRFAIAALIISVAAAIADKAL